MRKKFAIIGLFLLLLIGASNVYAENNLSEKYFNLYTNEVDGLPSLGKNTKILDIPIVGGLTTFALSMDYFADIVGTLCILFSFLMIIFNSFKLWAGTIELKKVCVDMIYKSVMCILICLLYKPISNSCLKFANMLGTSCCAGYQKINYIYTQAYDTLKNEIEIGLTKIQENILTSIETNSENKEWTKKWITEDTLKQLQNYGMTKEEVNDWAKQHGLSIAHEEFEDFEYTKHDAQFENKVSTGWYDENGKKITEKGGFWFFSFSKSANLGKADKKRDKSENQKALLKQQQEAIKKINALAEVLSGDAILSNSEEDTSSPIDSSQKSRAFTALKNVIYSPYLKDNKEQNTFFLSPSAMVKTCIVMGDAIGTACGTEIDENSGQIKQKDFNPDGLWTLKGILTLLKSLIFNLGIILCVIIVMAEYTITILEFYLVRGLATLLIPLLFLDSTKSYSQNLLKLFISYFLKIMTTVLLCFFSLGLFMDMAILTYTNLDLSSSLTVFSYISVLFTGLLLSLEAPKIAMAVTNGSPALGLGDIARIGHSARHIMQSANHMARSGMHMASGAVHGAQGVVRGGMNVKSTLDAAASASQSAKDGFETKMWQGVADGTLDSNDWSQKDVDKVGRAAARNTIFGAMKQGIADKAYKAATGQERVRLDEKGESRTGFVGIGQQYTTNKNGETKKGNNFTVAEQNTKAGNKIGENTAENFAAKVQKRKEDKERNSPFSDLGF